MRKNQFPLLYALLLVWVLGGCDSGLTSALSNPFEEEKSNIADAYYTELIDIQDRGVTHLFDEAEAAAESLPSDWKARGEDIYRLNCAGCHGAQGQGAPNAYPALAGTRFINGPYGPVVTLPMFGKGAMPSFSGLLSDTEIAMVLSYIRGAWGNDAPAISPHQVALFRNPDYEIPLAAFELFFGMTQGNDYATIPE